MRFLFAFEWVPFYSLSTTLPMHPTHHMYCRTGASFHMQHITVIYGGSCDDDDVIQFEMSNGNDKKQTSSAIQMYSHG